MWGGGASEELGMSVCNTRKNLGNHSAKNIWDCGECSEVLQESYDGELPEAIVQDAVIKRCLAADRWLREEMKTRTGLTNQDAIKWADDAEGFQLELWKSRDHQYKVSGGIGPFLLHLWGGLELFFSENPWDTLDISRDYWGQRYDNHVDPWVKGATLMAEDGENWFEEQIMDLLGEEKNFYVAPPSMEPYLDDIFDPSKTESESSSFA